jgi:predicted membrane protein (TIGR00267 family)
VKPATRRRLLLPLVLGLSDGILDALVLASAAIVHAGSRVTVGLAIRIALVGLITSIFTIFVAEYAHLRAELARAERQLNLARSGRLATSRLGRVVTREALQAAAIASAASFLGSLFPLLLGAFVSSASWVALVLAVGALAGLGAALARAIGGHLGRWMCGLAACGVVVAAAGIELKVA